MARTILILTTMVNLMSVSAVPASKTSQEKEDTEEVDSYGNVYESNEVYTGACTSRGEECKPATDDCCQPWKCISHTPQDQDSWGVCSTENDSCIPKGEKCDIDDHDCCGDDFECNYSDRTCSNRKTKQDSCLPKGEICGSLRYNHACCDDLKCIKMKDGCGQFDWRCSMKIGKLDWKCSDLTDILPSEYDVLSSEWLDKYKYSCLPKGERCSSDIHDCCDGSKCDWMKDENDRICSNLTDLQK